tara:strand:+ start:304 stop:477 length:174 start_codon:yes stop_codon:yes gene_type:complete
MKAKDVTAYLIKMSSPVKAIPYKEYIELHSNSKEFEKGQKQFYKLVKEKKHIVTWDL